MTAYYLQDTFTRTVASGGWGTPDVGPTWTFNQGAAAQSVNGSSGLVSTNKITAYMLAALSPSRSTVQIEFDFQIDKYSVGGSTSVRATPRYIDTTNDYHLRITIAASTGATTLQFARADLAFVGSSYSFGTIIPGTVYRVKALASGLSPTSLSGKIWDISGTEPGWQLTTTDNTAGYQVAAGSGIRFNTGTAITNGPVLGTFDNVSINDGVGPVSTGQIGIHSSLCPASDSITIGCEKVSGTTAKVALCSGTGVEIVRTTVSTDTTTSWGNAVFTGLTANTPYTIKFYVDDILQTDVAIAVSTLPSGAASYVAIGGSCQFTGSNHPVFTTMKNENAIFLAHMGDIHYADATTEPAWRAAIKSSMTATNMKSMLESMTMHWSMDNHDRIITDSGGAGAPVNYGTTSLVTAAEWKYLAGSTGWATSDTLGRTWVAGRVRYIQADMWTLRQDPDSDTGTLTFLGATQKAWWKSTLLAATEPVIVWFCNWTMYNNPAGRWNSFPAETSELETWLNTRPSIKRRMIMIGGDSHSLQADSGVRTGTSYRFNGIPSLNMSGFNRSSDAGDSGTYDIANAALRITSDSESNWGSYSRITISDNATEVRFKWEAVRVNSAGVTDIMAYFERSYSQVFDNIKIGSTQTDSMYIGNTRTWRKDVKGNNL